MNSQFDVIVVGGGHAGTEAALAAARSGVNTLFITMNEKMISSMPCNPSIGGIAKSHLVFELDALGGEMAKATDFAGLQFRVLNTRRGAAVQANRAQCDKYVYSQYMQKIVAECENLTVLSDEVVALLFNGNDIIGGVKTKNNGDITLENTLGNIISMCEIAKANKIIPIICSVLPADRFGWRPGVKPAADIVKLNEMLKEYADSKKIQYIDYYSVLADENGGLPKQHAEDGVHPNLSCYKIMEKIVLESL
jgi:hypothetical protein